MINEQHTVRSLEEQLDAFAQRYHQVRFRTGLSRTLMVGVVVVLAACWIDYRVAFGFQGRLLLTAACYGLTVAFALFGWLLPSWLPVSPEKLAWMIEQVYPDFNEKLVSSVELRKTAGPRVSMELLQQVLREAEMDLSRVTPQQALPLTWRHFVLPSVMLLVFAVSLFWPGASVPGLVKRVMLPSARDAAVGAYRLELKAPQAARYVEGQPIRFEVFSSDRSLAEAELVLDGARHRRVPLRLDEQTGLLTAELADAFGSFEYRAVSGRVSTRLRTMDMIPLPRIDQFDKTYRFPDYTGLEPVRVSASDGGLRALAGSKVTVTAQARRPLASAWVEYQGTVYNVELIEEATAIRFTLPILESGSYTLHLTDRAENGAVTELSYAVERVPDRAPAVELHTPEGDLMVAPDENVALRWSASDDFGIVDQRLAVSINRSRQPSVELSIHTNRMTLDLSAMNVFSGDRIYFRVVAEDAIGQSGRSDVRALTVVQGSDLRRSEAYLAAGAAALDVLRAGQDDFVAMVVLRDALLDAQKYGTERALENLAHNQSMLDVRRVRLRERMRAAERACRLLGDHAFFSRGGRYAYRTADYQQLERKRRLSALTEDTPLSSAWEHTAELYELSTGMVSGLVATARAQVPHLSARFLHQLARHACRHDDEQSLRWRQRIQHQAAELAAQYVPAMTNDLHAVKIRGALADWQALPVGFDFRIYPERDRYPSAWIANDAEGDVRHGRVEFAGFDSVRELGMKPDETFAARWQGYLWVKAPGRYRFQLEVMGSARLILNGQDVVRNEGSRSRRERDATVMLEQGLHEVAVVYRNQRADGALRVTWQADGQARRRLGGEPIVADLGEGAPRLLYLVGELDRRLRDVAEDFSEIDRLAREMREAMDRSERELDRLAAQLRVRDAEGDWRQIEHLAEQYEQEAAAAATVDERRDMELAADAFQDVARDRDAERLQDAIASLRQIEAQHAAEETSSRLSHALEQASAEHDAAARRLRAVEDSLSLQEASMALAELERKLEQAAQVAAGAEDAQERDMREVRRELETARQQTQQALRELHEDESSHSAGLRLDETRVSLERADALVDSRKEDQEDAYAQARSSLEALQAPADRVLARAREDLDTAAAQLDSAMGEQPDPQHEDPRAHVAAAVEDIQAVAEDLRRRAEAELLGKKQQPVEAKVSLALAGALEQSLQRTEQVRDAIAEDRAPPGASEQLKEISGDLADLEALVRDREAGRRGALSVGEQEKLAERMEALVQTHLPPAIQHELAELERIQNASRNLDEFRKAFEDDRRRESDDRLADYRRQAEQTSRELAGLLAAGQAEDARAVVQNSIEAAQREAGALREAVTQAANDPEKVEALSNVLERKAAVEQALSKAETAREVLFPEDAPRAQQRYQQSVEPPLAVAMAFEESRQAAAQLEASAQKARDRSADGHDGEAANALQDATQFAPALALEGEEAAVLQQALDDAGRALQEMDSRRKRGQEEAARAAGREQDSRRSENLRQAARLAQEGKLDAALRHLEAAGDAGKQAAEHMKAAKDAATSFEHAMAQVQETAQTVQERDAPESVADALARAADAVPEFEATLATYQDELASLQADDPETMAVRQPQMTVAEPGLDEPPASGLAASHDLRPVQQKMDEIRQSLKRADALGETPRREAQQAHAPFVEQALAELERLPGASSERNQREVDALKDQFAVTEPKRQPRVLEDIAKRLPSEARETREALEQLASAMQDQARKTGWEDEWRDARDQALRDTAKRAGELDRQFAAAGEPDRSPVRELADAVERKAAAGDLQGAEESAQALERSLAELAADRAQRDEAAQQRMAAEDPGAVAPSHIEEAGLAELTSAARNEMQQAARYPELHEAPLEHALDRATRERPAEARRLAEETPYGRDAADMLREAEDQIDAAWDAMREAVRAPAEDGRRRDREWQDVARRLEQNDLRRAAEQAGRLGDEGKPAQQAIENARQVTEAAREELARALQDVRENNSHRQRARDLMEAARQQAAEQTAQTKERIGAVEQGRQDLMQAAADLDHGSFEEAAEALQRATEKLAGTESGLNLLEETAAYAAAREADTARREEAAWQAAAEALEQAADAFDAGDAVGVEQALSRAQEATDEAKTLSGGDAAVSSAAAERVHASREAVEQAAQAGEAGKQAAQAAATAAGQEDGMTPQQSDALADAVQEAAKGNYGEAAARIAEAGAPGQDAAQVLQEAAQAQQQAQSALRDAAEAMQQAADAADARAEAAASQAQQAAAAAQSGPPQAAGEQTSGQPQASAPGQPASAMAEAVQAAQQAGQAMQSAQQQAGQAAASAPADAAQAMDSAMQQAAAGDVAAGMEALPAEPWAEPVRSELAVAQQGQQDALEQVRMVDSGLQEYAAVLGEDLHSMDELTRSMEEALAGLDRGDWSRAAHAVDQLTAPLDRLAAHQPHPAAPLDGSSGPYADAPAGVVDTPAMPAGTLPSASAVPPGTAAEGPMPPMGELAERAAQPVPPGMPQAPSPGMSEIASAAGEMARAAQNMAPAAADSAEASRAMQNAQAQLAQAQQQMAQQAGQAAGMMSMAMSGGGGEGGSYAEAREDRGLTADVIGDGWDGASGRVRGQDMGDRASRYSPYYRKAMQQYMQRIAEERAARGREE